MLFEDNLSDINFTLRALKKRNLADRVQVLKDAAAGQFLFGSDEKPETRVFQPPKVMLMDLKLREVDGLKVLKKRKAVLN